MKTFFTRLSAILFLLLSTTMSYAAIIYVDADATGSDDGTSWSNAFNDLQDAIAASVSGDEIWVAEGIYKPTTNTLQTASFGIPGGVSTYGGFFGGETSLNQRNWNENETILSGEIGNQSIDADNSNAVVSFANETGDIIFDGFIVEEANSSSTYNFNFTFTDNVYVANCIFRNNFQSGLYQFYFNNTSTEFENCLFHNNESLNLTGAFVSSSASFYNCTFANNDVTRVFNGNTSGITNLYNCISWGNDFSLTPLSIDLAENCILQDGTSGIASFSNILSSNPLFVNPSLANYSLLASSPAINYGNDANVNRSVDLSGNIRISDGGVDCGAYEFQNPDIIYVDAFATGANNGSSWANAYNELPVAFGAANIGDQIWVANGTYKPTTTTNRDISFFFPDGVAVYGGFAGGESNLEDRDWNANTCILSGNIGGSGNSDNTKELLLFNALDFPVVLDGFKVQDGKGESILDLCIYLSNSNVTFAHCEFRNNIQTDASFTYIINSSTIFDNCLFRDNTADSNMFWVVVGGDVLVNNCTLSQNDVGNAMFISNTAGELSLLNTISYGNTQGGPNNGIDNASHCIIETGTEGMTISDNIISDDPQFINPASNNFYLELTSPAINFGLNANLSEFDLGYQTRLKGGIVDAGCYEKQINDIVYVDDTANGNQDGSSWADAYETLSNAIAEMGSGVDYWVAEGTYLASYTNNANTAMNLPSNIKIIGGFNGTETSISQRDVINNETIISGEIGGGAITDNTKNLFFLQDDTGVVFDGLYIQDAYTNPSSVFDDRGAIRALNSEFTVLNCIFRDNVAYYESCINSASSDFIMENCLVYNNSATAGGIIGDNSGSSDMTIINTTITDNTIAGSNAVLACLSGGTLLVNNTIIWNGANNPVAVSIGNVTANNCILESGTTNLDSFTNIRSEDPLFVDPVNNDYQITASSNAYDSGNPVYSTQLTDLNGDPRIIDTDIDRGCFESSVCEQPNDLCANAIELFIDDTATFGSNRCATNTPGEESTCFVNNGHSVWYTFEAPASGSVEVISTWVSKFTSIFNTRHVVFEGTCGSLTQIACDNDNTGGNGETTPVSGLTPGETYYIRFDGFNTQEGRFTIRVESAPIPPVPGVTYVDQDATGANDGSSWADAYNDLQDAMANDNNGDIIWVAEGIYKPASSNISTFFNINSNISIYGGFAATETALNQRDVENNLTILSGEIGNQSIITDNSERIMHVNGSGAGTVIDGFIFEGSYEDLSESYNLNSALTANVSTSVNNCIFRNNQSNAASAITFIGEFSDPGIDSYFIENCLFYDNNSNTTVIQLTQGFQTEIINCTFTDNTFQTSETGYVLSASSSFYNPQTTVVGSIFWNNSGDLPYLGIIDAINCITEAPSPTISGTETVVHVDPLFSNPGANDYTLTNASPAIGYGVNSFVSESIDLAGNVRIQQTTVDAGCYESSVGTTYGCIDPLACNFDPSAQTDDGSCLEVEGCTDSAACNYDSTAECDDGSCDYGPYYIPNDVAASNTPVIQSCTPVPGYTLADQPCIIEIITNDPYCINTDWDNICVNAYNNCLGLVFGCTNVTACNYDSAANTDDGSCILPDGCTNPSACNYSASAQCDDGSCILPDGCTNSTACNYSASAQCDDGSCILPDGCTDNMASNYDPTAQCDDGSCIYGPSIIYVDIDANGNDDGTSWTDAYTDLAQALNNASNGDQVWIAEGMYIGDGFNVGSTIGVYGGFDGTESSLSQRDWTNNETIISGDLGVFGDETDNSQTVMLSTGLETVIDGLIIQDCYVDPSEGYNLLAALKVFKSSTVKNCVFRNNHTVFTSAVLFEGTFGTDLSEENYLIENCLFYNNSSEWNTFRAYYNLNAEMVNCTFSNNDVDELSSAFGKSQVHGDPGSTNFNVRNSIIWGNSDVDAFFGIGLANNCISQSGTSGIGTAMNVFQLDPFFMDPSINDYTLSGISPALDAGSNIFSSSSVDLAGMMRIQDGTIDIGCYEGAYSSGGCEGDANLDGLVNILDLVSVSSNFGCNSGCVQGDANFDGIVNILDLIAVSSNFGFICP